MKIWKDIADIAAKVVEFAEAKHDPKGSVVRVNGKRTDISPVLWHMLSAEVKQGPAASFYQQIKELRHIWSNGPVGNQEVVALIEGRPVAVFSVMCLEDLVGTPTDRYQNKPKPRELTKAELRRKARAEAKFRLRPETPDEALAREYCESVKTFGAKMREA